MHLPFGHEQFLDVFGAYNRSFWWAALLLWLATAAVAVRWLRHSSRAGRAVMWLLVAHWMWSGVVYQFGYFRATNRAATVFGVLFLVEAGLLARAAASRPTPDPGSARGAWRVLGLLLVGYGLVYPLVGLALGLRYPRLPTFGVPCPTAIVTIGFLLTVKVERARVLAVVPLIWAVIGSSAAFGLGIRADLMLAVAGLALLVRVIGSFGTPRPARASNP